MPNKIDFIGGNTKRCLMAMALPMIAAMFLNMMYNLVDSLWMGQSQILCKLQMRHEQSRIIHCARQRIYPTAALCAV